jgi:hypothetical protein
MALIVLSAEASTTGLMIKETGLYARVVDVMFQYALAQSCKTRNYRLEYG